MAKKNREKRKKLSKMYRFAVIDDESHKNLFIFRGTRLKLIIVLSIVTIVLIGGMFSLVAYTPIRLLIPGYPSYETQKAALDNASKADSLENEIKMWKLQLVNIQRIITGKEPLKMDTTSTAPTMNDSNITMPIRSTSKEDSLLREEVVKQEQFNISSKKDGKIVQIEGLLFFPPVKGVVTEEYNRSIGHPYIDIATSANSIVSAILDGTIISAGWTDDAGYTIQIQHSNDLISIYKHNIRIIKQPGERVQAGTPISIVGDAGKLSTGTHLHFELWHKGEPINPTLYINF